MQTSTKFNNKNFENSRSQIVFRTDIFRKLLLGAPVTAEWQKIHIYMIPIDFEIFLETFKICGFASETSQVSPTASGMPLTLILFLLDWFSRYSVLRCIPPKSHLIWSMSLVASDNFKFRGLRSSISCIFIESFVVLNFILFYMFKRPHTTHRD